MTSNLAKSPTIAVKARGRRACSLLAVFLNRKLVTADFICPLLHEFRSRYPGVAMEFYCDDRETKAAILENVVVGNTLVSLGPLRAFGGWEGDRIPHLRKRLRGVWFFFRLLVLASTRRVNFLHFRALDEAPYHVFFRLFPRRVFLVQVSPPANIDFMEHIVGIYRPSYTPTKKRRSLVQRPLAAAVLAGCEESGPYFRHPDSRKIETFILPVPFGRRHWKNYLNTIAADYFENAFPGLGAGEKGVVYILSPMGPIFSASDCPSSMFTDPDLLPGLMEETLSLLEEALPRTPVFIKAHPGTSNAIKKIQAEIIGRHPRMRLFQTGLHPQLLARRGFFFLCNYPSAVLGIAKMVGVPTVEYSRYSGGVLTETNGGSLWPETVDYFFNGDREGFKNHVRDLEKRVTRAPAKTSDTPDTPEVEKTMDAFFTRLSTAR